MKRSFKKKWSRRLANYPGVRVLLFDVRFRITLIAILFGSSFLVLSLLRIWKTSPAGFRPVIRVRGLDLAQSWSLSHAAVKATESGQFDEAATAWKLAFFHNPSNVKSVRGIVRTLLRIDVQAEKDSAIQSHVWWLLKLTNTNLVDLELAATAFERSENYDALIELLESRRERIGPFLAALYLKALFEKRRMADFGTQWNLIGRRFVNNQDLDLYHAAYLTGWGPPGTGTEGLATLEAATEQPAHKVLAAKLLLAVCVRQLNADRYERVLRRLEGFKADTLGDQIGFLRLLASAGNKSRAAQLAEQLPAHPSSSQEAVSLAEVFAELGLRDRAVSLLNRVLSEFRYSPNLWIIYAEQLIEAKKWNELRRVAFQIRLNEQAQADLTAYSYYLEGRAELAISRQRSAETAFENLANSEFNFPNLGIRVAKGLLRVGYPDVACNVLAKLEKLFAGDADYWSLLFEAADASKRVDLMVRAGSRAFNLQPHDLKAINNYAVALLINRENPAEAIRLTMRLRTWNSHSLVVTINHAAALLMNHRAGEAESLLRNIDTNKLDRAESPFYYLHLCEAYFDQRKFDSARETFDQIESNSLYPSQREWLERTRQQMPKAAN